MLKSSTSMVMQVSWCQGATAAQGRPSCGEPTPTPSLAKVMCLLCYYMHLACLCSNWLLLISSCIAGPLPEGDKDPDQIVPLKLKESKRFKNRQVIGVEIGGQMTFILSKLRPETVAATDHATSHTPPEPAPADMQA